MAAPVETVQPFVVGPVLAVSELRGDGAPSLGGTVPVEGQSL
jgi:hypothetical protein